MLKKKQKYGGKFKAKIALEALKEHKRLSEISSEYGIHSTQITRWRNQALEGLPEIFSNGAKNEKKSGMTASIGVIPTDRSTQSRVRLG